MKWIYFKYMKWRFGKKKYYHIEGYNFYIDKITVIQYAEISNLIDEILTQEKVKGGMFNIVGKILLKFNSFAQIIFAGQKGVAEVDFNTIDGPVAYEIVERILKKNPKLMNYAKNIIKSFGLNAGDIATAFQKLMR